MTDIGRTPRCAAILCAILCLAVVPLTARSQIVGTKHDLSQATGGSNWGSTGIQDQVCIFCHTPHHASAIQKPLWNRQETAETFTPYSSPTFTATFSDPGGQPRAESKQCMSCHDGVTALNAMLYSHDGMPVMDGGFNQLGDVYYPGSPYSPQDMGPNIGELYPGGAGPGDLANDHPVSFTFDAALIAADAAGAAPRLQLPVSGSDVHLFGTEKNQLECSSCHDVHSNVVAPFLVKSNTGSALCLTCHIK